MAGLTRLWHCVGRRGLYLLFLVFLDATFGWFLLQEQARLLQPFPFLSPGGWAIWWLATAAVLFPGAFMKTDRVPFFFATILKTAWAMRYLYGWYHGVMLSWISAVLWLAFAGITVMIASWPEADMRIIRPDPPEVNS